MLKMQTLVLNWFKAHGLGISIVSFLGRNTFNYFLGFEGYVTLLFDNLAALFFHVLVQFHAFSFKLFF